MEQIAIATILSDMDKEIADLEAQRDKYRLLKSGMMQKAINGTNKIKDKIDYGHKHRGKGACNAKQVDRAF